MAAHATSSAGAQTGARDARIEIELGAAIVTVEDDQPQILVTSGAADTNGWDALPSGPFSPHDHRTLELGLRRWVKEQTQLDLGYVEQLYTFGDYGRHSDSGRRNIHTVSIGYLALVAHGSDAQMSGAHWSPWYSYMPWEDWRNGKPKLLDEEIEPRLREWSGRKALPGEPERGLTRKERLRVCFAIGGGNWDDEKVLERYELLYEAGLVCEAARDGREAALQWSGLTPFGRPMQHDHRRILATAIGRLRAKLKYRPVVFELLPETFTLYELQKMVEAIHGAHVHKQNFRRLVESGGLVEPTNAVSTATGGRPARLYRFRREVLLERPAPGVRIKVGRG
ncbi:MAG: NAD regulator [Alphaproteobacteria bacterium]|nr:MAG: NAD regulator [Alphaproteobacteria bacterium]